MNGTRTIDPDMLAKLEAAQLKSGAHGSEFRGEACSMEWVALLAGEGMTDAPQCASPVLTRFTITLNDRWDAQKRQTLKPYLPRMVGTGGDGKDALREQIAARYVADLLGPWLRLAGLDAEADALDTDDMDTLRRAARAARDAAWTLRRKRYDLIRQKVRERLAEKPAAVAVAVAVADAAAVAAAVADADADAAAAAAAAAVAAAVADAAAAAAADTWGTSYSAAYKAARAYYEANPLPIAQEIADLAASQQGVALELLDKMIDPQVIA